MRQMVDNLQNSEEVGLVIVGTAMTEPCQALQKPTESASKDLLTLELGVMQQNLRETHADTMFGQTEVPCALKKMMNCFLSMSFDKQCTTLLKFCLFSI